MSYPLVPPPLNDTGAWQIPRTLQRWLDINPITHLTRTQAYITLPAFNVNVNWLGYSDIVASFNYEGPNNFSLIGFNIEPSSTPNYLLCIMWKDSKDNVNRYKLWSGVGEILYFNIPVYAGQKIGKNFRLEIWSTNNTPAIQTNNIQVYTSVLGKQDYRWGTDFTLVSTDGLGTNFGNINTPPIPPSINGLFGYDQSTGVYVTDNIYPWNDRFNGLNLDSTAIHEGPLSIGYGTTQTPYYFQYNEGIYLSGINIQPAYHIILSTQIYNVAGNGQEVILTYSGTNGNFEVNQINNKIQAGFSNLTLHTFNTDASLQPVIIECIITPALNCTINLCDKLGNILETYNAGTIAALGNITEIQYGQGGVFYAAGLYGYSSILTNVQRQQVISTINYYSYLNIQSLTLPFVFPANASPQSN
jgi:hypothetical protein